MALSKDTPILEQVGNERELGVYAAAQIYEGSMVGLTGGYARALVAGDVFMGHSLDNVLGSSTSGEKKVKVKAGKYRLQVTITSVAVTDIDKTVYASADGTYTLTAGSNSPVGKVSSYVTTNTAMVEFTAMMGTGDLLVSPRIKTSILDINGCTLLTLTATASAVNALTYANAAAGNSPSLTPSGTDTNIGLTLAMKGTGVLTLCSAATQKVSFFGVTGVVQQNHQADVSSGTTVDTNSRTRINAILATLETYGLLKLS